MGRPPDAGSVTAPARKVSRSPYAGANVSQTASTPKQHTSVIYYVIIAFVAALVIMFVRSGRTIAQTGPVLVLNAPAAPDQSQIDNLTQSINALAGQVHVPSSIPTGGASTPIVGA